jgi:hypothetical protein
VGTPIDRAKLLTVSVGRRTRDHVQEWRSDDGQRHKAVTDELGATVTQHARPNNTEDRQDVLVRPATVHLNRAGKGTT